MEERLQDGPHEPVDDRLNALLPGALVQCGVFHEPVSITRARSSLQSDAWTDDARVLRGALAGAVAAGVWAAQQPLDKRVFGVDYDDAELLGAAITRRRGTVATFAIGHALHVLNGAVFGAAYAAVSPRRRRSGPGPRRARGPDRARGHLAAHPVPGRGPPRRRPVPPAVGRPPRARPGDLAPPALRDAARDHRGAPEPAPGRGRAGRRGPLDDQRARQRRAPDRHPGVKALITGGTGFAGRHLAEHLSARRRRGPPDVSRATGTDLTDAEATRDAVAQPRPTSSTTSPRRPTSAARGRTPPARSAATSRSRRTCWRPSAPPRRAPRSDGVVR